MELNEILQRLRKERNLKQSDVAQAIHVVTSAISKYEQGINQPAYPILLKLADFYDVNLDYLLGRTDFRVSIEKIKEGLRCV